MRTIPIALACLCAASPALAGTGFCTLNGFTASGTYGFSGQGTATSPNPFTTDAGPFTEAGTVTLTTTGYANASTIHQNWSVTTGQVDPTGYSPALTFGGYSTVNLKSCTGDFFATRLKGQTLPQALLAFHVVFVAGGDEVRTIAAIPGIYIQFNSARKL